MRISKKQFYIITVLFLLLPFSLQWKLFLFGTKTTWIVVRHTHPYSTFAANTESRSTYSIIQFEANNKQIEFRGLEDLKYPIGKKVNIIYNTRKPSQFVMLNFAGLFLSNKMIIPVVFLIIWFAFYLTIRQTQQLKN